MSRKVSGRILSSTSTSLSRAARTLHHFIESGTAAQPEIVAYLRRAAAAFDELLELHDRLKRGEDEGIEEERKDESFVGLRAEQNGGLVGKTGDGDSASEKKEKKKRKREKIDGLEQRVENGMNLDREIGNSGDGEKVNGEVDLSRKKKKRKKSETE